MEKSEKAEKFEEAAMARDRIFKLKRIENKKIIQDLKTKQQEEISYHQNAFDNELNSLIATLEMQSEKILENKNSALINLQNKQQEEKDKLIADFEANYPNEPKFSSEVLDLQKKMDGHIKNREYEKANEMKIKIIDLCGAQDNKHKSDEKEKKLNAELKKLNTKHTFEMSCLEKKWDLQLDEFNKKGNKEKEKVNLKYKNKFMDLSKAHKRQQNDQEKLNKKNMVIKPTNNSKFFNSIISIFLSCNMSTLSDHKKTN